MKFTYFAARGTGDQIRLLLAEAGISYQECIVTGTDYAKMKVKIPFEQLPMWGKLE